MTGRNPDRAEQTDATNDRPARPIRFASASRRGQPRLGRRLGALGAVGVAAVVLLVASGAGGAVAQEQSPYTTIDPASPGAEQIQSLYKLIFWMALVVFIGVQFAIVYTAMRFRRSAPAAERPAQIHGNRRLEIIWTVIPAVVLLIILIPTITTLYDQNAAAEEADIVVDVFGKRWWWEVHYQGDSEGRQLGVVTANELHLPVNREVIIRLHSNNVIHSFWVPRLAGKMDIIPGHVNSLSITPTQTGEFFGECTEFCGTQHAWMRFKVVVHSEENFYRWVNAWRTGHPSTLNQQAPPEVVKAPAIFAVCLACHRVNGLEGSQAPIGLEAPQTMGPNLTNFGCRDALAAGILVNNRENLIAWLANPEAVKPGNYMATQIKEDTLTPEQEAELADYLLSLKPAGGCIEEEAELRDQGSGA